MLTNHASSIAGSNATDVDPSPECLNAGAYVAISALSNSSRKWGTLVRPGTVLKRDDLERPGVDIARLCRIKAIRPASALEISTFEQKYGEPREQSLVRERELTSLRDGLSLRVARAERASERAALVLALMAEWRLAEAECRQVWESHLSLETPRFEEDILRFDIQKGHQLKGLVARSEAIRECMEQVADPLMVDAEDLNLSSAPLRAFLRYARLQETLPNFALEFQAEEFLTILRYKLLGAESQMAKRTKASDERGAPQVTPQQGAALLQQQLEKGDRLLAQRPLPSDEYSSWENVTRAVLEKAFGRGSPNVTAVTSVGSFMSVPFNASDEWWEKQHADLLRKQLTLLRGLLELLQTEEKLQSTGVIQPKAPAAGHRVFLVHGHDEHAVEMTSRFLEKLGLEVVILRDQPNKGRTIIEKFEEYTDVGYAVVLLTPDDRGGTSSTPYDQQKPRARQNVMLELGYFIGRLGRKRVCALHRGSVEIPSDYSGVLYEVLDDSGGWRLKLARELKAAEFPIDMNDAL